MLNFRKPNPYSLVLSALACLNFNFFADAQVKAASPLAQQPESTARQQQNSIARQRQSLRTQEESVARQRTAAGQPPRTLPAVRFVESAEQGSRPFECEPTSPMVLETAIHNAAQTYGVASALIQAVIRQESGGYPCAVSDKGAMGLMQLMPDTAADMGAIEPFDVSQNVAAGTRLLAELMQRYKGDLNRVLGAYNAGTSAVDRAGGTPPFPETINYVHSIVEKLKLPVDPKLFARPVR
jgi:soluble lytic murein transglycosylase-like protein